MFSKEELRDEKQAGAYNYIKNIINAMRVYDNTKPDKGFVSSGGDFSQLTTPVNLVRKELEDVADIKLFYNFYREFAPSVDYVTLASAIHTHLEDLPKISPPARRPVAYGRSEK